MVQDMQGGLGGSPLGTAVQWHTFAGIGVHDWYRLVLALFSIAIITHILPM